MSELTQTIEFYLLSMSFGLCLFSALVNSSKTGAGFIRLLQGLVLGCLAILVSIFYFVDASAMISWTYLLLSATCIYIYVYHADTKSLAMWSAYIIQIVCFLFISYFLYEKEANLFLHFIFSAILIGITTYSMILGHYYLVVPRLSERPLLTSMEILWVALVLKIGETCLGLSQNFSFFQEFTQLGGGYAFNWMLLAMRVLWGYVALFILSIFAWKLCRMRSIQSATGILYVMVFFVIVGELISGYLFFKYGLFL